MQLSLVRMRSNLAPVCSQNIFKSMRVAGGQRNAIVVPEKCHSTFFIELRTEKLYLSIFIDNGFSSVFLLSFFLGQTKTEGQRKSPCSKL